MINIKTPATSGLAAALMALFLAGCNGQEDFSDAVIGGDPLGSGIGAGANFNANDACAPRVIGTLEDEGTLRNIRYTCDGFYGYTGLTGLPDEQEQNLFVCPLGARSVTFLLGGRENNLPLGTAYFRSASSRNAETGCVYNSTEEVYDTGQYDADGLYLFTVSDLVISPARIDAVDMTGDGNENKRKVRNVSGLLRALDTQSGDALITVDQVAHDVFIADNSNPSPFNFPASELIKDYAEFTALAGVADQYINRVENETAATLAGFPSEGSIPGVLLRSNRATNAGLYRFEMVPTQLDSLLVEEGVLDPQTLYSHQLAFEVASSSVAPGSAVADPFLSNVLEFMPVAMVTRRGDVTMGGSFSVIDYDNNVPLCEPEGYDYSAFSARSYELDHEGTFANWAMDHAFFTGDTLTMRGRLFTGYAFSNETSNTGVVSDYSVLYGDLPAGAYQFFDDTDRTEFDGDYCGTAITDQPVFTFSRAGTVVPRLDPEVMQTLAPDGAPLQYTLSYLNRANADDVDPTVEKASLRITIHRDGAVFTDLYDASGAQGTDGNTAYVPNGALPAGEEFQIGMVSSLFRDPLNPLDPSKAVLNLIVYNYAPLLENSSLPMYGSHFRARLVPDTACEGGNRLYPASLDFETDTDLSAVWYDPYAAAQAIKSTDPETDAVLRYESLRKQAYGYVEAVRTDCPPPP